MTSDQFTQAVYSCNLSNEEISALFDLPVKLDIPRRWRTGLMVPKEDMREKIVRELAMEEERVLKMFLDKLRR